MGFAEKMNSMPKYVVSTTIGDAEWNNSTVVSDLDEIAAVSERHRGELLVYGSATLLTTLLERGLVEELRLMIFPVVLGAGKRLFADGVARQPFEVTETKQTGEVVIVTLRRAAEAKS
jgi:dihydrofolate reductase